MSETQRAIRDWLTCLFLALVLAYAMSQCGCSGNFGLAQEEIDNYQIREWFARHLSKTRHANASELPSDVQGFLLPAIKQVNGSLDKAHNVKNRYNLFERGELPANGILVKFIVWKDGLCNEEGTVAWVEGSEFSFVVKVCVDKIKALLSLRGALRDKSEIAKTLQGWDNPWVCVLARELMRTDLPEPIFRGGKQGLM